MSAVRRAMSAEAREHLGSVTVEGIEPITLWSCPSNIRNPPVVQMNSDPDGEQNDGNPHSWPQPSRKADHHYEKQEPNHDIRVELVVVNRPMKFAVPPAQR